MHHHARNHHCIDRYTACQSATEKLEQTENQACPSEPCTTNVVLLCSLPIPHRSTHEITAPGHEGGSDSELSGGLTDEEFDRSGSECKLLQIQHNIDILIIPGYFCFAGFSVYKIHEKSEIQFNPAKRCVIIAKSVPPLPHTPMAAYCTQWVALIR